MTAKIRVDVELPDDDLEAFLEWIVAFDRSHAGCVMRILALDGSTMTMGETWQLLERLGLTPFYSEARKAEPSFQQMFDHELEKMEMMRKSLRKFGINIPGDDDDQGKPGS